MKPSVLIAVGCSWVAGRAIDIDPSTHDFGFDHVEDPAVVETCSFAGLVRQQLGLDQLVMLARNGSNNDEQSRKLFDYIEQHHNEYSRIVVLWGITSIYRWEMYFDATQSIMPCMVGGYYADKEIEKQVKYYFSNHWNKPTELEKLGRTIVLLSTYLTNLGIEHLFFNSFQSYNSQDFHVTLPSTFYKAAESNNDLLSLLCNQSSSKISKSSVPWLNVLNTQYAHKSIAELQNKGLLDNATAHPTKAAHAIIADELLSTLRKYNERF
jgi:hypothetical protein